MDRQKVDSTEIELIKELSDYITFYEKPAKQTYDENVKADFATLQIVFPIPTSSAKNSILHF